jgi:hypothetical protein
MSCSPSVGRAHSSPAMPAMREPADGVTFWSPPLLGWPTGWDPQLHDRHLATHLIAAVARVCTDQKPASPSVLSQTIEPLMVLATKTTPSGFELDKGGIRGASSYKSSRHRQGRRQRQRCEQTHLRGRTRRQAADPIKLVGSSSFIRPSMSGRRGRSSIRNGKRAHRPSTHAGQLTS